MLADPFLLANYPSFRPFQPEPTFPSKIPIPRINPVTQALGRVPFSFFCFTRSNTALEKRGLGICRENKPEKGRRIDDEDCQVASNTREGFRGGSDYKTMHSLCKGNATFSLAGSHSPYFPFKVLGINIAL